jgi:CheY-like chemotaxis protein
MQARVLIIEDDADLAEALSDLVEQLGYDVRVAYSGVSGCRVADTFHPDVVLCDLTLPGPNGFEIARTLRSRPETAKAKLIALSGDASAVSETALHDDCFDSRLLKPIDSALLAQALE